MNQLQNNVEQSNITENQFKAWFADVYKSLQRDHTTPKEWMSIKEACDYIGVAYNTFSKFRELGLRVCEINGVKKVSKTEVDRFLNEYSY